MTAHEFFTAVDVLEILRKEQDETLAKATDLQNEIFAIIGDIEELILQGNREITASDGKQYLVEMRVFAGLREENQQKIKSLIDTLTGEEIAETIKKAG